MVRGVRNLSNIAAVSVHNLEPLENGGPVARAGFDYQDHVAAAFCLEMLNDSDIASVWCESLDDITLIRRAGAGDIVEFVQVKSNDLGKLWSTALLCQRENKKIGTSILEKSLAHDRCVEPCIFRVVTRSDVNTELKILTKRLNHKDRVPGTQAFKDLYLKLEKSTASFKSQNGNTAAFWAKNVFWDVRSTAEDVRSRNLIMLEDVLYKLGQVLAPDQKAELYNQLLQKTQTAGRLNWNDDPSLKKIDKDSLLEWLHETVETTLHPFSTTAQNKLAEKMSRAKLHDYIEIAEEHRRYYRQELLKPRYLSFDDLTLVGHEVGAVLTTLKAKLDNGKIPPGSPFYEECLMELGRLQQRMSLQPPISLLHGCMYETTNRCLHRFDEVKS